MTDEAKEARRKYEREYYAKHPEKAREKARRYWERKAGKISEEKEKIALKAEQKLKTAKDSMETLSDDIECLEEIIGEAETFYETAEVTGWHGGEIKAAPVCITREDIMRLSNIVKAFKEID